MLSTIVEYLRNNGAVFNEYGAVRVRSWTDYRVYRHYQKQIDKIALVEQTFKTVSPIVFSPADPKCPQCRNYRQYFCRFEGTGYKIPTATFQNGCDRYSRVNIYF